MYSQREEPVPLEPDDRLTQYRFCLDALLATLKDIDEALEVDGDLRRYRLILARTVAKGRADRLAGMLFDKWIESD